MFVMFPGTKNRAPKLHQNTKMPIFIQASKETKPLEPPNLLEKAALIPGACIFHVFESSEARERCLSIVCAPLAPTNPRPPLASNFLSGKAEPSPSSAGWLGLSKQALAACTLEVC